MRISVKARYGLSAMICLAQKYASGEHMTVISLSDKLKISKIYLEQTFSLLKRAKLVISIKGSQGGYKLAKRPMEITAYQILSSVDTALFEKTEDTFDDGNQSIERIMRTVVFDKLEDSIKHTLSNISLEDLKQETEKQLYKDGYMFYL